MIDLSPPITESQKEELPYHASAVIHHENDSQLVHFYHATVGAPAISTFIEATARGYLDCFPHLTVRKIRRNKPHTVATSLGHLDQTRKNYKSTKPRTIVPPAAPKPEPVSLSKELDDYSMPTAAATCFSKQKAFSPNSSG
jgi:hypothetical protein